MGFRVHFAIRVLNDPLETPALNGPFSTPDLLRAGRYHLSFNAKTGSSFDRCATDLYRFALEIGIPWFLQFREAETLLTFDHSPLSSAEKQSLMAATNGRADQKAVSQSLKQLGIESKTVPDI